MAEEWFLTAALMCSFHVLTWTCVILKLRWAIAAAQLVITVKLTLYSLYFYDTT